METKEMGKRGTKTAWKYEARLDWKVKRKNISWSARIET